MKFAPWIRTGLRRRARALGLVCLLVSGPLGGEMGADTALVSAQPHSPLIGASQAASTGAVPAQASDAGRLRAQLVELLALGLPNEALAFGQPLLAAGQALAQDGLARALIARTLFDAGREDEAWQLLDGAGLPAAEQVPIQLERARLLIEQDRLEEARALLQKPSGSGQPALYPEQPDCWFLLARCHARLGRLEAAALLAKKFLQLAPLDGQAASAWHLIAQEALLRGDAESANKALEKHRFLEEWHGLFRARRLQAFRAPTAALPRFGIGLLWMRVERYGDAEAEFSAALSRDGQLAGAHFQLGEARRLSNNPEGALEAYNRGLELYPDDLELGANRGLLLLSLGRAAGASDLERISASPAANLPAFAPAFLGLARHLAATQPERSAELYARYQALGGSESLAPSPAPPGSVPDPAK
jgi:tetratricopeptide (TPR) repeat protein